MTTTGGFSQARRALLDSFLFTLSLHRHYIIWYLHAESNLAVPCHTGRPREGLYYSAWIKAKWNALQLLSGGLNSWQRSTDTDGKTKKKKVLHVISSIYSLLTLWATQLCRPAEWFLKQTRSSVKRTVLESYCTSWIKIHTESSFMKDVQCISMMYNQYKSVSCHWWYFASLI